MIAKELEKIGLDEAENFDLKFLDEYYLPKRIEKKLGLCHRF